MPEKTGRGGAGEMGGGPLPQPERREPPRTRAPPWTAHSAGRGGGARRDPPPRQVDTGLRASEAAPKAQELALRQGLWDAGGERRSHKEKAALDVGGRRGGGEGPEGEGDGWQRKEQPGSDSGEESRRRGEGPEPPKPDRSWAGTRESETSVAPWVQQQAWLLACSWRREDYQGEKMR